MSKYTTEVRFICENYCNLNESVGFSKVDEILKQSAPKVFDFEFPIFDEDYRLPLEVKILRHYYTREICMETVGLWKLRLQAKLCEIMPYYNQLYKSALLEFDVFSDVDYTETTDGTHHNSLKKIIDFENLGGVDKSTYTKNGIEKNTIDYKGGSTNTTSYEGKETNAIDYTGSETNSTDYSGSEKDTSKTSGGVSKSAPTKVTTKSDTPQGGLNGFLSEDYLTTAQKEEYITDETTTYNNVTNESQKSFTNRNDTTTKSFDDRNDKSTKTFDQRKDVSTQQFSNRNDVNTLEFENRTDVVEQEKHSKHKTDESNDVWNKNDNLLKVKGKRNSLTYSEMLQKFRETFLNIDKMVIDEMSDLFFGLW